MPYEDDYKMWLEKALIGMNPDWICDGMSDNEFTNNWCHQYCGEDSAYITPKCLHMYYHHIARADRKTEPTISKMEQVDEPQYDAEDQFCIEHNCPHFYQFGGCMNQGDCPYDEDEPQTCSVSGRPYSECADCEHFRCTADEPQTEEWYTYQDEQEYNDRWQTERSE